MDSDQKGKITNKDLLLLTTSTNWELSNDFKEEIDIIQLYLLSKVLEQAVPGGGQSSSRVFDVETVMYLSLPAYKALMTEKIGEGRSPLLELISNNIEKVNEKTI